MSCINISDSQALQLLRAESITRCSSFTSWLEVDNKTDLKVSPHHRRNICVVIPATDQSALLNKLVLMGFCTIVRPRYPEYFPTDRSDIPTSISKRIFLLLIQYLIYQAHHNSRRNTFRVSGRIWIDINKTTLA